MLRRILRGMCAPEPALRLSATQCVHELRRLLFGKHCALRREDGLNAEAPYLFFRVNHARLALGQAETMETLGLQMDGIVLPPAPRCASSAAMPGIQLTATGRGTFRRLLVDCLQESSEFVLPSLVALHQVK